MTLVTGTVQDLGYDGMEGTLWARPARFRSDGQVVLAPERKPYKVVDGVVSADLAPGPAVLELQVGSHARGTFEVVIPEADTTLADLLDTVFPWEPAQVSLFVAEREAAQQAKADAEQAATLAGTAKTGAELAAQQTGQDRTAVASDKDTVVSHVQALAEPNDAAVLGLISEGANTATKAALNATYVPEADLGTRLVKVQAPQPPMLQRVVAEPQADNPRFLDKHGDVLYGMKGGAIFTSLDGASWTQVNATWPGTGLEAIIHRIVPTADGEMLAMSPHELRKSSGWSINPATATWSASKIVPNGSCEFNGFGIDGDGQKFIIGEYSPTQSLWADSRYVHISLDAGTSWQVKYDTVALHGEAAAAESHVHGVCYDRWADRFYVSEGHGQAGGVYGSATNGTGWEGPLRVESTSAVSTNGPTVLVATDDGLVMGSDNEENGLFGIPRRDPISEQKILRTWRMHTGRAALHTFAQRGWRDPDSGLVYVTFRSEYDDTPVTVAAGTAGGGGLVYEHPLPARAGWDRFVAVAKIGVDTLFFYAEIDGQSFHMRGTLTAPGGSDASLLDRGNTMGGTTRDESSLAVGRSKAGGTRSLSIGQGAHVAQYGAYSTVVGTKAYANSVGAVVVGDGAYGEDGAASIVVVGYLAKGMSSGATAIGDGAVGHNGAVAIGLAAEALSGSVALGANAVVTGNYALALGTGAKALTGCIAIGRNADASGVLRSVVIGNDLTSTDNDQVKFGAKHLEVGVLTADPIAPGYNDVREYYRRNASGKVEKCIKFADGSVVVVATQP